MKKLLNGVLMVLLLFVFISTANASLITIGTARIGGTGTAYSLIWDDDNNGNSIVWLDYANNFTDWTNQNAWAAGLTLTYDIDSAYSVDWGSSPWRLPSAGDHPEFGDDKVTSEMGHLFYTELGLNNDLTSATELNASNFDNLVATWYWSSTEFTTDSDIAWRFYMASGEQGTNGKDHTSNRGLAVRNAQVSTAPVPEPATMFLFGLGLLGVLGIGRKQK
jgi:hypothetical protein